MARLHDDDVVTSGDVLRSHVRTDPRVTAETSGPRPASIGR